MKVVVDQEKCIGCGACVAVCPAVFQLNEETHKAVVIEGADCDAAGCCQTAINGCGVQAISKVAEEVSPPAA
jgi:ferredoxin